MADPIDPRLVEALLAQPPKAPWRGPGERPAPGPNEPDTMPSWYRELQPYPVNIPAAIEGGLAVSGMSAGPAGAITSGVKAVAESPLARSLGAGGAAFLGLTAPSVANKGEAPAGQSMAPSNQAYLDLLGQQAALQKRLDEARAKMDAAQRSMDVQERTGRGPKYNEAFENLTRAKADFNGIDTQMRALVPAIEREGRMQDPAYQIELKKQQDQADEEKRRRTMNTSVKELFADYAGYAPIVSAGLAGIAGNRIKSSYVNKFNENINELTGRWEKAVQAGDKGLAQALMAETKALADKGAGGTYSAIGTGIGIGELGQVLPVAADYAKAIPGSDLYKKTVEGMSNPWEVGGRMFTGALLGGLPAKTGASIAARQQVNPAGYAAETNAMRPPLPPQLPPPLPQGSPNGPGPQGSGTSQSLQQALAGTGEGSSISFADVLREQGFKPANRNFEGHHSKYQPRDKDGNFKKGKPEYPDEK